MIRTYKEEEMRYGPYSRAGEFEYDFPHLWGSKINGPDIQKIGKKYGDLWHYKHMEDPLSVSPNSIMPKYDWLLRDKLNTSYTEDKLKVMAKLGVPYSQEEIENAKENLMKQAENIANGLKEQGVNVDKSTEIIALISYLQRLGIDGRKEIEGNKKQAGEK
jgi:cytochrome c oxidase cbb3-type subunit I/II